MTTPDPTHGPAPKRRRTQKAKSKTIQLTIHISPDLHERLHQVAEERMVNPGLIASRAIEQLLERLEPPLAPAQDNG